MEKRKLILPTFYCLQQKAFFSVIISLAGASIIICQPDYNALAKEQAPISEKFQQTETLAQPFPIPAAEASLQTVMAKEWFKLPSSGHVLEGAIFDGNGDLLFCDSSNRKVMRLSPDKKLTTVLETQKFLPTGLALYKGRIYITAIFLSAGMEPQGDIWFVLPDGSDLKTVRPQEAGYAPDDLIFDENGGLFYGF